MNIQINDYPLAISQQLVGILISEIEKNEVDGSEGVILNFRDPDYGAESGGYHPVEIAINEQGRIQYITDFAYVGMGPYAELEKELDFDFGYGLFQQMGREYPITQGAELFTLWQSNFCDYYQRQVYEVSCQPFA